MVLIIATGLIITTLIVLRGHFFKGMLDAKKGKKNALVGGYHGA